MANFFIDRPIFAWVLAIILCLTGALAIFSLPVEQYPNLAPPNVRISATYPGASAQTLENTVTQIIEQNMTGLDNMMYMSSQSTNTGQATVTLTFEAGTDPNEAMQQVQNQLQAAIKRLPQAVQNQGVTVSKSGDTTLMMVAFVSTDNSMDKQDIADYIVSNLQDPLSRINGVGSMDVYGSQYAMRIWLDPNKLNSYQLTTQDVVKAIQSQNAHERQFDHFDIFIFNAAAGRAPLIVMVFGDKEVHDFSHAARRHVRFEDFLHLADLKTGLLHRFAARALLRRVGVQQAGAGLEQHAALVAVDVGRHAELIGQHHRALGAVVQQNGSAVATIVDLAHLLHRTAVFAFQIERVLVQHIPVVRQQLFLHILNFRRHNPFPLRDNVKIIPRLGRAAADDLQQKSHRLSG